MTPPAAGREHDLVLFGASSFVGALTAEHLASVAPAGTRIALAGRSRERVEAVRARLPDPAGAWPVLVADSTDAVALAALARSARVVVSTVGPYARYGLPLVTACAAAGTHYADLTGEVQFVRAAIDAADAAARESGARLVHSCGYDSVPSDLAVLLLHQRVSADGEGELAEVTTRVRLRGGASGGTVDSVRTELDAVRSDRAAARLARDPHALSPDRAREPDAAQPADHPRPGPAAGEGWSGAWTAPFVMASYNTRVVRRSNALTGWSYGRGLRYGEVMATGSGVRGAVAAGATAAALGGLVAGLSWSRTRPLLDRLLPAPGTGPSAAARQAGWFRHVTTATTTTGARYAARVTAPGDPGYAATAVMLGESALALALDPDRLPAAAGSLTPATGLGRALVERLRARGHAYEVERA